MQAQEPGRQHQALAGAEPGRRGLCRECRQEPVAKRPGQAALLGQHLHVVRGAGPLRPGLPGRHLPRRILPGPKHELQAVTGQRLVQRGLALQALDAEAVELGGIELDQVAAQGLGAVQRQLRALQQRHRVVAGGRIQRNADADGAEDLVAGEQESGTELRLQALREPAGGAVVRRVVLQKGKAAATERRQEAGLARRAQAGGGSLQQLVAQAVAQGFVDVAQVVDVEQQQRRALRAPQQRPQRVLQRRPAGQAGQQVDARQPRRLLQGRIAVARPERKQRGKRPLLQRHQRRLCGEAAALLSPQPQLLDVEYGAAGQGAGERGVAPVRADPHHRRLEQAEQMQAAQGQRRQPQPARGLVVGIADAALAVDGEQALAQRLPPVRPGHAGLDGTPPGIKRETGPHLRQEIVRAQRLGQDLHALHQLAVKTAAAVGQVVGQQQHRQFGACRLALQAVDQGIGRFGRMAVQHQEAGRRQRRLGQPSPQGLGLGQQLVRDAGLCQPGGQLRAVGGFRRQHDDRRPCVCHDAAPGLSGSIGSTPRPAGRPCRRQSARQKQTGR